MTYFLNHSLVDKFRGAWVGSYLGGIKSPQEAHHQSHPAWGKIAEIGVQSLIELGYLDLIHWQEQILLIDPTLLNLAGSAKIGEAIWATLPIMLFFHEQPHKLTLELSSALNFWLHPQESAPTGLAVAKAIAILLSKNPYPLEIIKQTDLEIILGLPSKFWQDLPCLESAIKEITRHTPPGQVSIAIACYCFLYTPEDFRLSIKRAILAPQPELITPLVGILSGSYNGFWGIPFNWYWESLNLSPSLSERLVIKSDQSKLIDHLFNTWAGHYRPPTNTLSWRNQIVTAPASK